MPWLHQGCATIPRTDPRSTQSPLYEWEVDPAEEGIQPCPLLPVFLATDDNLTLAACVNINISLFDRDDTPTVEIGDIEFEVEVADTPTLQAEGTDRSNVP